jgi:anti-sigma B factor antagonist
MSAPGRGCAGRIARGFRTAIRPAIARRAAQDYLTPHRARWMITGAVECRARLRHGRDVAARESGRGIDSRTEPTAMATGTRRLDIEEVGDVTVAKFTDKKILDETNIQIIGNQLFGLVDEDHRQKIVLDFSNVEYLSSAALGKLITMDKKVKGAKGKLRLCAIKPDIYEVFAITKLNKLFQIYENQEQALQGF